MLLLMVEFSLGAMINAGLSVLQHHEIVSKDSPIFEQHTPSLSNGTIETSETRSCMYR